MEITAFSGALLSQWKIGDLSPTTHRISIYHLVSTGTPLVVQVEATLMSDKYPTDKMTISDPVFVISASKP
jgi:hypothetical protein